MKYFSLAVPVLASSGYAFTGIPFGRGTDAGTISFIEKDNLMIVELKKEIDEDCSKFNNDFGHAFGFFDAPSALTDFKAQTKQPFEYCRWDQMGHMLNKDEQPQVIPGDAFKEVSNFGEPSNKCVAIFEPSVKLREFNTVKYMGYPGIAEKDLYCATLTSGKTAYGAVEVPEGSVHFFRSSDKKSFAVKPIPADYIQEHIDMDFHDGIIWVKFFDDNSCTNPVITQDFEDMSSLLQSQLQNAPDWSPYPMNFNALWINAPENAKALTFGYDVQSGDGFNPFANSECIRFKKNNGDVDFKRANRKLVLDPSRSRSTKYVGLSIEQDNPFVPSKYTIKYNHKDYLKAHPDHLPGGYHIHETPADPAQPDNCAVTGGHWNPYNKNKVEDPDWAYAKSENGTHFDFEIGDLSARYGSLGDQDGLFQQFNDWNLPLFGDNSCVGKSIVFHRADDNSRLMCFDLTEHKYDRSARFGFF